MDSKDLFAEVKHFRRHCLKHVATEVTTEDGKRYIENSDQSGSIIPKPGIGRGYIIDRNLDIQVALVIPGLLLGSQDAACELKILHDFQVTHILNIGYRIPNYYEAQFVYKNVEVLDVPTSDLRLFFDGCFEFIDDGRQEGCVFVHCNAGVSRAPTIVIAYLMNRKGMMLSEALALVKSVRPCVRPNEGFRKLLNDYEKELFQNRAALEESKSSK